MDPKQFKYVWLAANSGFKADSDLQKYEKARKLKDHIVAIRSDYTKKVHRFAMIYGRQLSKGLQASSTTSAWSTDSQKRDCNASPGMYFSDRKCC